MGASFQIVPTWSENVGNLHETGAAVSAFCPRCNVHTPVDLERLIAAKGPLYSLWNRQAKCKTKTCSERVFFIASLPGHSTWPTNMRTPEYPHQTDDLHKLWQADRDAKRRADIELSWLRKLRRRRSKVRAKASALIDRYGPDAIRQAELDMRSFLGSAFSLEEAAEVRRAIIERRKAKPLDDDELPEPRLGAS